MKLALILGILLSLPLFGIETQHISESTSFKKLLSNISPEETAPGTVIASPSRHQPNYWYHWVRDAALVMRTFVRIYAAPASPELKRLSGKLLTEYAHHVRKLQSLDTPTGLGEPKYHANGEAFLGPWGRPQNDGPALRAATFINWANTLLDEGHDRFVREILYNPKIYHGSVIKNDLEYTSHHWMDPNFDYWEEVKGHHFANMMAKRRALAMGAQLARRLGDHHAAAWYALQAQNIQGFLRSFWEPSKNLVIPTRNRVGGLDYKSSDIDITTILGVLHSPNPELFSLRSPGVQRTFYQTLKSFQKIYPLNKRALPGTLIGRYPEDRYDGETTVTEGHGWFLATFAMAEYSYRLFRVLRNEEQMIITKLNQDFYSDYLQLGRVKLGAYEKTHPLFQQALDSLINKGDAFIKRADYHAARNGSMSEQINRHHGYMRGARDLTWSYASHLSALWARP